MAIELAGESAHKDLWGCCLNYIKPRIGEQSFETWFSPLVSLKLEGETLQIQAPNKFHIEWLESHYSMVLSGALKDAGYAGVSVSYSLSPNDVHQEAAVVPKATPSAIDDGSGLNDLYTFDNFVEGPCNQFARAAANAVAEAPGKTSFNPLFIYGGVGLGKTHLAQAIGNRARIERSAERILYVSSERFTLEFINALEKRRTDQFTRFYRSMDLLIVDDIQFLVKKEATQEQFFHTFNALYQDKKQIVLTSDRPPKELHGMESRLVSRFQAGLSADLQEPDLETRTAILRRSAEDDGINLSQEVIDLLAANITDNIRELKGSIIRLLAYASLTGAEMDIVLARRVLKEVLGSTKRQATIEDVIRLASDDFGVEQNAIIGKGRTVEVATARQVAMFLTRTLTEYSLKTIGLHFGGRDHSTVIHACKLVEKKCSSDQTFFERVDGLKKKLEYSSF